MSLDISHREVLNNLIRFKDSLLEKKAGQANRRKKRIYKVLLNRHTGNMQFAKKISEIETRFGAKAGAQGGFHDWEEAHLIAEKGALAHFELLDAKNHSLNPRQWDPLAWRVLSETLQVLNQEGKQKGRAPSEVLPEEWLLLHLDFSSLYLSAEEEGVENLPGWAGPISRQEAEARLRGHPVGTYLWRSADALTLSISFHLSEENHLFVHPYLLTFVDREEKISELFVLHTGEGWICYLDDPSLEQPFYHPFPTLVGLLQSLKLTPPLRDAR